METSAFPVNDPSNLTRRWIDEDIAIVQVPMTETKIKGSEDGPKRGW